jgi:hypothetical protein
MQPIWRERSKNEFEIPPYKVPSARTSGHAGAADFLGKSTSAGASMNSFYEHHKDNIRFHYRCFDRILLNGLI